MTTIATTSRPNSNSRKMLQAMVGIGVFCALLIVLTYEGTLPRIEKNRAEALNKAIYKVLPGTIQTEPFVYDKGAGFAKEGEETVDGEKVYAGYDDQNNLVGIAIQGSGQGYADVIRVLYGYDLEKQKVIGIHVLESKETPGLGDKIEKDKDFLANFIALDATVNEEGNAVKNVIVPVKSGAKKNEWEVEGITGATISSRAIGNILGESTAEWAPQIQKHRDSFITNRSE